MNVRNTVVIGAVMLLGFTSTVCQGFPANANEVAKLSKAGVGDNVILAYVNNLRVPFSLTADDILALKDQGVTSNLIAAMLSHNAQLRTPPAAAPQAVSAPGAPEAAIYAQDFPATAPPPAQVEVVPVCPGPYYYWNPGYWGWNGGWIWIGGLWSCGRVPVRLQLGLVPWLPEPWVRLLLRRPLLFWHESRRLSRSISFRVLRRWCLPRWQLRRNLRAQRLPWGRLRSRRQPRERLCRQRLPWRGLCSIRLFRRLLRGRWLPWRSG